MVQQTANISVAEVGTGRTGTTPGISYPDPNGPIPAEQGDIDAAKNAVPATVTWDEDDGETLKGAFEDAIEAAFAPLGLDVLVNRSEPVGSTWDADGAGFYAHPLDSNGRVVLEQKSGEWTALSIHVQ